MNMSKCLVWLFGRGASASCGLNWTVPEQWHSIDRDMQAKMIKETIRNEMNAPHVDTMPYRSLLAHLKNSTKEWHHRFVTTNWDFLLEREIKEMGFWVTPHWLPDTTVYHLNGTVEDYEDSNYRSDFLLETDSASMRKQTVEANVAFNHLIWQTYFVVIGMSFSCKMDRSFFYALSRHQDNLPICNSNWLIVNRSQESLDIVASLIQDAVPRACISVLNADFAEWVNGPMKELQVLGALNANGV
jgi:hypothetical protein